MAFRRRARRDPTPYSITLRPDALKDLDDIAAYIAQDSPSQADRFIAKIFASIAHLDRFPTAFPLAPETPRFSFPVRQLVVRPYRVLFIVEGSLVRVLRVYHGSRAPLDPERL